MEPPAKSPLDFIAIGDIVTDAFIRITNASVHRDQGDPEEKLCVENGAKVPYEFVAVLPAVGNSPNAAVCAARLGLSSGLISDLGDDEEGARCLAELKHQSVNTSFVTIHPGKKTNYHYVLWFRDDRTILIKHEEYPYVFPEVGNPRWMYLSSMGEHSLPYHDEIARYLNSHPDVHLAFQPGTFQIKLGVERLRAIYEHTEIFFCNVEEARLILKDETSPREELAKEISALGPKIAVVTDGPRGAFAHDGTDTWYMPPYPDPAPPYERTGAGDAFASTFTAARALGKSVAEALAWAPINSMSVVQKIGAQQGLLTREALETYLKNAPPEYTAKKI
ncbi:MAG: carbohydrate kinase family protein [Minisyncoccota bacterium]